jgi:hypothetical protein
MIQLVHSLLLAFTIGIPLHPARAEATAGNKVWICDSKTSVAYHSKKDCAGLSRCTHQIIEISEEEAKKEYDKRKCKMCF